MKRGFIISIIVVFVLTFGFFEQIYIENTFSELREKTLALQSAVLQEEDSIAKEEYDLQLANITEYWQARENVLYFFANPFHIDEIDAHLSKLKVNFAFDNKEEALVSLSTILSAIENFVGISKVSWQTII